MSRLLETGATERCSDVPHPIHMDEDVQTSQVTTKIILQNIVMSINCLWHVNDEAVSALCMTLADDGRTFESSLYIVCDFGYN